MALHRESRELAQAIRRNGIDLVKFHGQRTVMAVVRQINPLVIELTMNDIIIDDDHLLLGAWPRFYDQEFGIVVGDTLLVSRLANGDWFVYDVVTKNDMPPAGGVYVDDRTLDAAVDHVLFDAFPSTLRVLELSWWAHLDGDADGIYYFMGLLMNGDAEANEIFHDDDEYRWNVGVPNDALFGSGVSADENTYFNDYGVISWIVRDGLSTGMIRFPNYQTVFDSISAGRAWHGHGTVGSPGNDDTNPFVCAGGKEDYMRDPLTALALISTMSGDTGARQQFAAGSRFTLTGY